MRLKKDQKTILLSWIAEGLTSDEINNRADIFVPQFSVSRQQVDWYRKTRQVDIVRILAEDEYKALRTGLASKMQRVKRLKELAATLEKDLFSGERDDIWLPQVKGVGVGKAATVVDYEEFNRFEIDAYRGLLDDIAKEVGERVQKQDITTLGEKLPGMIQVIEHKDGNVNTA